MDPDQAAQATATARAPAQGEDYELEPELWPAWRVFDACWTQWRVIAGFGQVVYSGIEYTAVQAVMALHGIKHSQRAEVFSHIQVLEDEARKLLNSNNNR